MCGWRRQHGVAERRNWEYGTANCETAGKGGFCNVNELALSLECYCFALLNMDAKNKQRGCGCCDCSSLKCDLGGVGEGEIYNTNREELS